MNTDVFVIDQRQSVFNGRIIFFKKIGNIMKIIV
jgi:hypothetical protein